MNTNQHRPLYEYAQDIRSDYADQGKNVYFAAEPYVDAMRYMDQITDSFGEESGHSVVSYAVSNLRYWKGETATRVKAELRAILKNR